MVAQGPAGAGQPAKQRKSATANSHDPPAPDQPNEEEGIFDLPPDQQAKVQRQHAAAGGGRLGSTRFGRTIHVNTARFFIALCALTTLIFVVVASFITLWLGHVRVEDLMRVLEVLFAPLIALVGVAV